MSFIQGVTHYPEITLAPDSRAPRPSRRFPNRCEQMLERGLLEETAGLLEKGALDPASPAGRAIGYRQAIEFLSEEARRAESNARGNGQGDDEARARFLEFYSKFAAKTRQYASDQMKWFRSPKGRVFSWQVWDLGGDASAGPETTTTKTSRSKSTAESRAKKTRAGDGRSRSDVVESIEEGFRMSREAFVGELEGYHQASLRAENERRAKDMKRYVPTVTAGGLGHEPILRNLVEQTERLSSRMREARTCLRGDISLRPEPEVTAWSAGSR